VLVLESLWHPIHQRACCQSPIWGFQLKPCMELVLQEDSLIQGRSTPIPYLRFTLASYHTSLVCGKITFGIL
jgi:hypothetical protein